VIHEFQSSYTEEEPKEQPEKNSGLLEKDLYSGPL